MSYPDARYLGDEGEISAVYRPADQKPELTIGSGTAVRATWPPERPQTDNSGSTGGMRDHTRRGRMHTSTRPCPNRSSYCPGGCGCSVESAGSTRLQGIFCMSLRVECTPSTTSPTSRHQCCFSSHPARRARPTSKRSPRKPQVVSSARRSGRTSAAAMTTTFSDRRSRSI